MMKTEESAAAAEVDKITSIAIGKKATNYLTWAVFHDGKYWCLDKCTRQCQCDAPLWSFTWSAGFHKKVAEIIVPKLNKERRHTDSMAMAMLDAKSQPSDEDTYAYNPRLRERFRT